MTSKTMWQELGNKGIQKTQDLLIDNIYSNQLNSIIDNNILTIGFQEILKFRDRHENIMLKKIRKFMTDMSHLELKIVLNFNNNKTLNIQQFKTKNTNFNIKT